MRTLDWPGMLRAGLGRLRLRPDDFWALTPGELALMLGLSPGDAPMDRKRLSALMQLHPDMGEEGNG